LNSNIHLQYFAYCISDAPGLEGFPTQKQSKAKQSEPTKIVLHKSPEGTNPALISVKKTAQEDAALGDRIERSPSSSSRVSFFL
jgi:hypothetical protein